MQIPIRIRTPMALKASRGCYTIDTRSYVRFLRRLEGWSLGMTRVS
jgi:hypothetical protein